MKVRQRLQLRVNILKQKFCLVLTSLSFFLHGVTETHEETTSLFPVTPQVSSTVCRASVLRGSGGMLLEWLKIHPNTADTVNYFTICQANNRQI